MMPETKNLCPKAKVLSQCKTIEDLMQTVMEHPGVQRLLANLSYSFSDHHLFVQSLIHKSFVHESTWDIQNNEKLEFLGDSILDAVITEYLYKNYPEYNEGQLSQIRSSLVNEDRLSELAHMLNMSHALLLGYGEVKGNGMLRKAVLSDSFEALLGAVYLDSNFDSAKKLIIDLYKQYAATSHVDIFTTDTLKNYDSKSKLQEKTMKYFGVLPEYNSQKIEEEGQDIFLVRLTINGSLIKELKDKSKKQAEKLLAEFALNTMEFKTTGEKSC